MKINAPCSGDSTGSIYFHNTINWQTDDAGRATMIISGRRNVSSKLTTVDMLEQLQTLRRPLPFQALFLTCPKRQSMFWHLGR